MPKKTKKRAKAKKNFKAPWWKLFFVLAAATLIAIPIYAKTGEKSSEYTVLGEKVASDSSNLVSKGRKVFGRLIKVNPTSFSGWACDRSSPDSSLTVEFAVSYPGSRSASPERTVLGQTVANLPVENGIGSAAEKVCPGMTLGNNHRFSFTPTGLDSSRVALIHAYVVKDGEKIRLIESPRVIKKTKSNPNKNSSDSATTTVQ